MSQPMPGSAEEQPPEPSLKNLVTRGSIWAVGGYGVTMVVRLGSNIILTHMLFPEAFGLMLLVTVFLQGLEMFSDLGVRVNIVQHARGNDPDFLNTAWTVQVLRGFALWICSGLIAWPVARFYGEPKLLPMIPVAAFANVIMGFQSTTLSTLNRQMRVGLIVLIGIVSQLAGTAVMIFLAWWTHSVWSLLASGIVSSLVRTVLSHTVVPGIRNHFHWDPEARKALFGFGRWVFFSTAFTFLASQSDKLWLGKYLDGATRGVYNTAVNLSGAAMQVMWEVCEWILMPAFARVHREDSGRLREVYEKVRRRLDVLVMPCVGLIIAAGDLPVRWLWDQRYWDAGWMLQVMGVGIAIFYALPFVWSCQVALGDLRYWLWGNIGRTVWLWAGVPIVWHMGGLVPTIWFVSLSQLPPMLFGWMRLSREGILSPRREILSVAYLGGGFGVGWLLKHLVLA
jgi:O-antigen/teichoic acid export membrane protein